MLRPPTVLVALLVSISALLIVAAPPAGAQDAGPAPGVVYSARKGPAEVRLVGLGAGPDGAELVLVDVKVECGGFLPQGRMVGTLEEDGRFEVEGTATEPGTTDVVTGEFDDIDGKVRTDGAVLEIDIEVEGEDNAGPTGRCEETQPWRLEPRRSAGARRIEGATPIEATALASNGDALFTLAPDDGELARVDPQTMTTTWTVDVSPDATAIAAAGQAVWVLDPERLELTRIGALSGDVEATVALETPQVADAVDALLPEMTATDIEVWVAVDEATNLYRVDTGSDTATALPALGEVTALAPAPGGVYVAFAVDAASTPLVRLDPGIVPVSGPADALAVAGDRAWGRSADVVTPLERVEGFMVPSANVAVGVSPTAGASMVAAAPGVWTTTTRGTAIIDDANARGGTIPIIGSEATGMAFAEDAVFILDSGYLFRLAAG